MCAKKHCKSEIHFPDTIKSVVGMSTVLLRSFVRFLKNINTTSRIVSEKLSKILAGLITTKNPQVFEKNFN